MKQLFAFFALLFALTACEKEADLSQLDSDFIVSTNYDNSADFGYYSTYYIPDSILILSDRAEAEYWTATDAAQIIDIIVDRMNRAGYTRVTDKEDADLGLQPSLIRNTHFFVSHVGNPWWWGHPAYWGPSYWGPWRSWFYPYIIRFSFRTGSFLTEMADLKTARARSSDTLPLVWTAYMTGLLSSSDRVNVTLASRAIEQAFAQSPYINK